MNRLAAVTSPDSEDPPVTDIMSTHLLGITPDAEVATALRPMARTGVRHLLVMDGQKCRGMLAEIHSCAAWPRAARSRRGGRTSSER